MSKWRVCVSVYEIQIFKIREWKNGKNITRKELQ